jgi:glycosyltransferase involved in cell wall biosynthesis
MSVKILHVVGGMNRAGVETWLMHVLRNIDRKEFKMDFLVHTRDECAYDDEIRGLGSRIIPCMKPSNPWLYAKNLRRILREQGPYDVVHSHVHHYSGYVLRIAAEEGVPVRIAHSHNDTSSVDAKARLPRRSYLRLCEHWIRKHATICLACSQRAAQSLFGRGEDGALQPRVLLYGLDFSPFHESFDREATCAEIGIPANAIVMGHVGRFERQKNHIFMLDAAVEVARRVPNAWLLLVGDGCMRPAVLKRAQDLGIERKVVFAGSRPDVPRLMKGAMDLFLFPSLFEGLGLVGVEAQAAGLPCVFSTVIPAEADVVPNMIKRVSLDDGPAAWAEAAIQSIRPRGGFAESESLHRVEQSPFNIKICVSSLRTLYARTADRRLAA